MCERGHYENCRWCADYQNGSCASEWFTIESDHECLVDYIDFVEGGKLSDCIRESINDSLESNITGIIENVLSGHRIGKDRKKEILDEFSSNLHRLFEDTLLETLYENIDRALDHSVIEQDEDVFFLVPKDETDFCCSHYR